MLAGDRPGNQARLGRCLACRTARRLLCSLSTSVRPWCISDGALQAACLLQGPWTERVAMRLEMSRIGEEGEMERDGLLIHAM